MSQGNIAGGSSSGAGGANGILLALSFSHFLNDTIQSLFPALYPLLKDNYALTYTQIGIITLVFQLSASMLQPVVGVYTDKRPQPYSLAIGMGSTLIGLIVLAIATGYPELLVAAALVGVGSAVFHPEASRMARMASGGRYGLAQSVFQVGGNFGTALGPLLAAFIVLPGGQGRVAWFSFIALVAIGVLTHVGKWYKRGAKERARKGTKPAEATHGLPASRVNFLITILLILVFSKFLYTSCLHSYYTFFLIQKFDVSVQASQIYLFIYLASVAFGTLVGGPLGDRIGRKTVIWFSILGALPFTLALPYVDLAWTGILTFAIGAITASAFPTIIVFAQELVPGRVGFIAGIFFGVAFGMSGIGAALFGTIADATSIIFVFKLVSFLPLIGLLTIFLPDLRQIAIDNTAKSPSA